MGLLTRIADTFRAPMPARLPPELRQGQPTVAVYNYGKPTWPTASVHTAVKYYDQVVVAFACVNLIADAAATATVRVYDERDEGAEIPNHPLRELLRRPNPTMSEAEWLNSTVKIAAVCGFSVSEIERGAAGRPVALWPLRSDWLQPIPRRDSRVDWQYTIPGGERVILLAEDTVTFTFQGGPLLPAVGISPIVAANREIAIENDATNFIKAFFESGAVPQIGLVPREGANFDQSEADVLREKFMSFAQSGPWTPIVMQAISDVRRLGFDLNEMAYKDLRALTSTQIATAFRVPDVMLGTLAGLENSPWSKYEEARRSFYEDTITPLWSRLDGALTRSLLPQFETNSAISLEFDTSAVPALQEDDNDDWLHATAPGVAEFLTVNDRRALVGLPPIAGGDVRLLTIAQIEVPAIASNGSRSNGHEHLGNALWTEVEPNAITGDLLREKYLATADQPWLPVALPLNGAVLRREYRAKVGQQNKETIIRLGERTAPLLGRFWRAQGKRMAALLPGRADEMVLELRVADLADWDDEDRQLAEVMRKLYALNGKTAYGQASEQLGIDLSFDLANPQIRRVMDLLGRRVNGINATTRAQLATLVTDSLQEGVTMDQLAGRIGEMFNGYSAGRAAVTARTESQVSFNSASTLAYRESGVVDRAELFDNPNHGDYDGDGDGLTCAERNGMIVPLLGADRHFQGTHPNCVLSVAPVLTTELGEV